MVDWSKIRPQQGGRPIFDEGNYLLRIKEFTEGTSKGSKRTRIACRFEVVQPVQHAKKTTQMFYSLGSEDDPLARKTETIEASSGIGQLRWLLERAGAKFGNRNIMATCKTIVGKNVIGIFGPKKDQNGENIIDLVTVWSVGERQPGLTTKSSEEDTSSAPPPSESELDTEGEGNGLDAEATAESEAGSQEGQDPDAGTEEQEEQLDVEAEGEEQEEAAAEASEPTAKCPMCDNEVLVSEFRTHVASCGKENGLDAEPASAPAAKASKAPKTPKAPKVETLLCPLCDTQIPRPEYGEHVTKTCPKRVEVPAAQAAPKASGKAAAARR